MTYRLSLSTVAAALLLLPAACPAFLSAQTISTGPLAKSSFCAGESLSVDFTISGSLNPGNAVILQLSDSGGSFTNGFRNLASQSTTVSGTFDVIVPEDIITGGKYRFRAIASNPRIDGTDNGTDLALEALPDPDARLDSRSGTVLMRNSYHAVEGLPVTFDNKAYSATHFWWNMGIGVGAVPEQTDAFEPTVTYSVPGEKHVRFLAYTRNGCVATRDFHLTVLPVNPFLPADVAIVQGRVEFDVKNPIPPFVWVCPGGECYAGSATNSTIFVEAGGSVVVNSLRSSVIYMKRGASYSGELMSRGVIVYEEGAGIPTPESYGNHLHAKVPSLTFDYSLIPPGGCPSLAPYTVEIKPNASSIHTSQSDNQSNVEYWVRDGGLLSSNGSGNTYCVEAGGHVTVDGSENRVYLKDGATVDVRSGSANRIFYETKATIVNAGQDAVLLPSSGITFVSQVSSVSGPETSGGTLVHIVPNPADDVAEVRVDPALGVIRQVTLYNALGETILQQEGVGTTTLHMSLEDLQPGIYQVRVRADRAEQVQRLVIR